MQRIAVIGNGGGGKSHLCCVLGHTLHLPVFVIDSIQWQPGWHPAPKDEVRRAHDAWLQSQTWIIDGWGDWPLIAERFRQADAIIFVDFPLWRHYWWATKRMIKSCFHRLPEEPAGCSYARVPWRMYQTLWRVHHFARPRLQALLAEQASAQIIHVRSRQEFLAVPAAMQHLASPLERGSSRP